MTFPGVFEELMRKKTVRLGIHLVIAAISLVTLGTFFHDPVAHAFSLSASTEIRFVYLVLGWGGAIGCCGIVVAALGLFRGEQASRNSIQLARSFWALAAIIILFFVLLFSSFRGHDQPGYRPGKTVII